MFTKSFVIVVILSLYNVVSAYAVGAKGASTAIKVIGEALEEAKAVQAATKADKTVQVTKEANATEKAVSQVRTTQVLVATNQIIKECEKARKSLDKNWCSLQKDKISNCIEAKLNAGYVIEVALKQCKSEAN